MRSRAAYIAALALLGGVVGCGGGEPLENPDAKPQEIIDAWAAVVCDGEPVNVIGADELDGDKAAAAGCDLDVSGSLTEKRQQIYVFSSEEAVDTYKSTISCDKYLYVTGPTWSSNVKFQELATDLVQAGGELCKG